MATPDSPCTKVCVLDAASGFCLGCGRTGAEIGRWLAMSPVERAALNALLPARLALFNAGPQPAKRPFTTG